MSADSSSANHAPLRVGYQFTADQEKKLRAWQKEQDDKLANEQQREKAYYSPSGGGYTYMITPTSLGTIIQVNRLPSVHSVSARTGTSRGCVSFSSFVSFGPFVCVYSSNTLPTFNLERRTGAEQRIRCSNRLVRL